MAAQKTKRYASPTDRRHAFTLLEVILAVALSAVLLSLIGTAISLYLSRVDADRTRVEEALLARSVLALITDDIRAATIYVPQDTRSISELMAASTPFDVDSIDAAKKTSSSAGVGGTNSANSSGTVSTAASSSGASSSSASAGAASGSSNQQDEETLPLGLNGTMDELYVDVTRMPSQEELFGTRTGYSNVQAPVSGNAVTTTSGTTMMDEVNPPADVKTVRYFVRSENGTSPTMAPHSLPAGAAPTGESGLVRQEISRPTRVFAEQAGNIDSLDSSGVLIAPEVAQIQFRYFNGAETIDEWEMKEQNKLPLAVEVKIWLRSPRAPESSSDEVAERLSTDTIEGAREYRQIVYLPMAALAQGDSTASSGAATESSAASTGTSSSASASGSTFGP